MNRNPYGNPRTGLPHVSQRISQNEPVCVAFLGGSITEGYGASDPDKTSWRTLTGQYLQERFPDLSFTFINAGVGGTTVKGQGTGLLLICGPDTGIFEYSVNGSPFQRVNLFDDWCLGSFRPVLSVFPIENERGTRRVTVRNTGAKDQRSTGTHLRILKLLSN